jgi:choline kinase
MTTMIVPAAGRSTRFGEGRPKWMRTHPAGELMIIEAIRGIDKTNIARLLIVVVKQHIEEYKLNLPKLTARIAEQGVVPEFIVLDDFTSSQSETVYRVAGIDDAIFIKDCDNYFEASPQDVNGVCTSKLAPGINATNKSYIQLDKMGNISGIVEKQIVSDQFCCGGYSFASGREFCKRYEQVAATKEVDSGEVYISHIIQAMLLDGVGFGVQEVGGYLDWGDAKAWKEFCGEWKTLFIDIDGTLIRQSSEFFEPGWGTSEGLPNNIAVVNALFDSGKVRVILTTSRKSEYRQATEEQLVRLGVKHHQVVYDLPAATRVLVNDFADTNPYPSAVAINLERDADDLSDYLSIG